jgi:hypothetical protein
MGGRKWTPPALTIFRPSHWFSRVLSVRKPVRELYDRLSGSMSKVQRWSKLSGALGDAFGPGSGLGGVQRSAVFLSGIAE